MSLIALVSIFACLTLGVSSKTTDQGGYVITTPKRWTCNSIAQICVVLTEGSFQDGDSLTGSLKEAVRVNATDLSETVLKFTKGLNNECVSMPVPKIDDIDKKLHYSLHVTLSLKGKVGNNVIDEKVNVTMVDIPRNTFIQTDKYLYQPGQKVKFRVLTLKGPLLNVSTGNYKEIFVESPVGTRIHQWLNVDNSKGLVHLEFDLSDEINEGFYVIELKTEDNVKVRQNFKVEDYVLPRYEITIEPTKYILGSDEHVTLNLCARYTYGEHVKGNATLSLGAGSWKTYANITQNKQLTNGCEKFTFFTKELMFDQNNCHIRIDTLKARAVVEEEGTGVELSGANDNIKVHRQAVTLIDETPSWVQKSFVPFSVKVKAEFPDKSPAKNETMEVCSYFENEKNCKNFTTNDEGYLKFIMSSSDKYRDRIEVTAVNYPRIERYWNDVMENSVLHKYRYNSERYVDASNSSLTIYQGTNLNCTTGQDININIPVVYYVSNVKSADVFVQVVSRGQVQYMNKTTVDFVQTDLPYDNDHVFLKLEQKPEGIVSGKFEIKMVLPTTVSPNIEVLVWYTTENGIVVADNKEIKVTDCLANKVDMSWSTKKGEPGSETVLNVKGVKNSICSVGVVDKSVELLSSQNNKLSISNILSTVYQSSVARWDNNRLNLDYCLRDFDGNLEKASLHLSTLYPDDSPLPEGSTETGSFRIALPPSHSTSEFEAIHMFDNAGFHVMTNLILQKHFCERLIYNAMKEQERQKELNMSRLPAPGSRGGYAYQSEVSLQSGRHRFGAPKGVVAISADSVGFSSSGVEEVKERSNLPESWLWQLTTLSDTGESSETVTLPDTITEWVGRTVCVHPTEGVGISSTASITTFTPFFVDLTLPASVIRGEVLPLKISVFNYLAEDLPVRLTLEASEDYEFASNDGKETGVRQMCISAKEKSVQVIPIKFKSLGDVNITVEAGTHVNGAEKCGSGTPPVKKDRLKRSLPIEAEGYLREKTWSKYICSNDKSDSSDNEKWTIESPADIVEGSDRAWITAIGDLMGPTLENIGHLVRMPSGCGEQNMINFAPNIYILQYLDASNQTTDKIRGKIQKYLEQGYQKQLRYRHSVDGSFSVFGEKDANGSTWLTAFVVKSFAGANKYTFIDAKMLNQSVYLLKGVQNETTGCFESRGRVVNKMLQGGISSSGNAKVLLSSYVLAAILEANSTPNSLEKAVACIASDNSSHPYSLALRAYSLALAKSPRTKPVIEKLLGAAVSNSSSLRWNLDSEEKNEALEVETAAYALLALLLDDAEKHTESARKIVRWLSSKRNGQGGFITTQDTVVALQALAAYEKVLSPGDTNTEVTVTIGNNQEKFRVQENNKFLQQRSDLVKVPSTVEVAAVGSGCALIQGVLRYNVLAEAPGNAFALKVNVTRSSSGRCQTRRIEACASYTLPDKASNFAILEFKLISGYVPVKEDLKSIVGGGTGTFKRYEVDGSKVVFYLEEVTKDQVCAAFHVDQEVDIGNAKPVSVSVYDYYQPEYKTTEKYEFKVAEDC